MYWTDCAKCSARSAIELTVYMRAKTLRKTGLTAAVVTITALLIGDTGLLARAEQEREAVQSAGERARLLWKEGTLLHLLGRYEEAVEHFRRSIDLHATPEAHTYLGWSLGQLQRYEEAIAECKHAIALDPDYGNPYNDIGVYLIELGHLDEAVPWLRQALQAERYCCYHYAYFNLGRVLMSKGQLEAARRAFVRALSYNPGYRPALEALEFLRESGIKTL